MTASPRLYSEYLNNLKQVYLNSNNKVLQEYPSSAYQALRKTNITGKMGLAMNWQVVLAGADGIGYDRLTAMNAGGAPTLLAASISSMVLQYRHFAFEWHALNDIRGKGGEAAYLSGKTLEIDTAMRAWKATQSAQLFKDRHGDLGRVTSSGAAVVWAALGDEVTVTLDNFGMLRKMQTGMQLDFYTTRTDGTGSRRLKTTQWVEIGNINAATRQVGLILRGTGAVPATTERINDGVAAGPGDYVFYRNMRGKHPMGIADYVPLTDADIDATPTLNGIDRRKDRTRLAGGRVSWQGSFADSISSLLCQIGDLHADAPETLLWLSNENYQAFLQEGERNRLVIAELPQYSVGLGTNSVSFASRFGTVKVASDPFMTSDRAYLMDMSKFEMLYTGPSPIHVINDDGNTFVRTTPESNIDGVYMEFRSERQLKATDVSSCGVFDIPAAVVG